MILIDKNKVTNRVIVTITENTTNPSQGFKMVLKSLVTLESITLSLPSNTSQHRNRYDEFVLATVVFNEMKEGQYIYTIHQIADNKPLETGLLELVGDDDKVEFITLPEPDDEDDFIVYTPQ